MFMRCIIISLLTLTILFSNMAWAMDECALQVNVSEQNISSVSNTLADDGSESVICNIFCVGWAQLLYIGHKTPSTINIAHHFNVIPYSSFYHSLNQKPPTEPPQA